MSILREGGGGGNKRTTKLSWIFIEQAGKHHRWSSWGQSPFAERLTRCQVFSLLFLILRNLRTIIPNEHKKMETYEDPSPYSQNGVGLSKRRVNSAK